MTDNYTAAILTAFCIIAAGLITPQKAYSASPVAMLDATVLTRVGVIDADFSHLRQFRVIL